MPTKPDTSKRGSAIDDDLRYECIGDANEGDPPANARYAWAFLGALGVLGGKISLHDLLAFTSALSVASAISFSFHDLLAHRRITQLAGAGIARCAARPMASGKIFQSACNSKTISV